MRPHVVRIVGFILGGIVIVLGIAAGGIYFASNARLNRTYAVDVKPLTIPTDQASIERGQHLAVAATHCTGCHGENLGGQVMVDAPPFRIVASNITRGQGGTRANVSDADLIRAIRDGVHPDGTSLKIMPSGNFAHLNDDDLAAIIAYVKSVPPVDSALPTTTLYPLGRTLLVAGKLDILSAEEVDHTAPSSAPVPAGATPAYGNYLVTVGGCRSCHSDSLAGGVVPDGSNAHATNITPSGLAGWNEASFIRAMREGKRPNGSTISPIMPWQEVGKLSDDELRAIWMYLQSVPAS